MTKPLYSLLLFFSLAMVACKTEKPPTDSELASEWAEMTLFILKNTPSNTPTFASRSLGYIGLTMYESVVQGFPSYQSLQYQLDGLDSLPIAEVGKTYHWGISLNAAQAEILRRLYIQTSDANKAKIDSLEAAIQARYAADKAQNAASNGLDTVQRASFRGEEALRSISFGKKVAEVIFEWSKTDGGHRGYLQNFDKKWVPPVRAGGWKPPLYGQSFSHFPLHPHWGKNRTFLVKNRKIAPPSPNGALLTVLPFDTLPQSPYYQQFFQVYQQEKQLTQDQKQAAVWWGDDPDETFTPPGHSYYLANTAVKMTQPTLIKCAETYAKTGLAVADAFIKCWEWKYQFFTERPNTYIVAHIDERWESFWPDPPFPAFPSGHAIQAAAAATVLTDLYGDNFAFTDKAHVGRKRDALRNTEFKARSFKSFWQAAEETALSRFYGGIHIPQDNAVGIEKGKLIGQNIIELIWRK
jgi:hypothetical protein